MRLSDFIMLGTDEKKLTVLHQGVLIAKRKQSASMIFLFQLDGFYVETWCNQGDKSIEEFRMFEHTHPLNPYLDDIRIEDLLN
ncbi:MAG: hypothetical protein ACXWB9_10800 [Flavisolibacter sp.]